MYDGSLIAGTSSSSQSPPDNEFETDKVRELVLDAYAEYEELSVAVGE